ncbi:MAG: NADPH:quinone oxidoreductase family protein [Pseudomonadota bacterium]
MRAMRVHELGKPLVMDDIAPPEPGPGQVRLRVRACGVNFADTLIVNGTYQEKFEPPFSPGMEICGTVDALGPDAAGPEPGTRVVAYGGAGGFAEYALVPADRCAPVPGAMSDVEAAAFPVAYGTSHLALAHKAQMQPGETLLVLGAAGGVGLTAVELGKLMGARVIACARGAKKLAVAGRAGADYLLDSDSADIRAEVKALGGADVVYDPVGGAQFDAGLRALKPDGRILPIGFASGTIPQVPANILLVKNISVLGFYWGGYAVLRPDVVRDSFATLMGWFADGKLRPHVSHTLPLDQADEALELLRSRRSTGKVVVAI